MSPPDSSRAKSSITTDCSGVGRGSPSRIRAPLPARALRPGLYAGAEIVLRRSGGLCHGCCTPAFRADATQDSARLVGASALAGKHPVVDDPVAVEQIEVIELQLSPG